MGFWLGLALGVALGALAAAFLMKRAQKKLGRFFSFAAHEINTPITAVNMTVLNFLSGVFGEVPPEQLPWMEMMREQLGRLNGMLGDLRDLIHFQLSGELPIHREAIPAEEAAESALRLIRRGCAQAGIPVAASLAPGLPPLWADPDRLPRILASLLFHARKFRVSGGIAVEARAVEGKVLFEIRYAGSRLSRAEAAASLDLFYPAMRQGRVMSATGLGLGMLRVLIRRQEGELEFEVDPEGRSRLLLLVPCRRQGKDMVE